MTVGPDLSRVQCGYCTRRAHAVEWEGDAQIPVCKEHAQRHQEPRPT